MRPRLYFQTAKASDGSEPNPNLRTLQGMKSNYGVPGGNIDLKWKNGLFVPVNGPIGLDKMAAEAKVNDAFIAILKKFTAQNRTCSPNPGPTYAPVMLAAEPEANGSTKAAFALAMSRLRAQTLFTSQRSAHNRIGDKTRFRRVAEIRNITRMPLEDPHLSRCHSPYGPFSYYEGR